MMKQMPFCNKQLPQSSWHRVLRHFRPLARYSWVGWRERFTRGCHSL